MKGQRHPARRVAIQLAVCLLLGAAVTVAVAWVLAMSVPVPPLPNFSDEDNPAWPGWVPEGWGPPTIHIWERSPVLRYDLWLRNPERGDEVLTYNRATLGWPFPSLVAERVWTDGGWSNSTEHVRSLWRCGIPSPLRLTSAPFRATEALPLRPLCIPFLLDTLVFGASIALPWFGRSFLRRLQRRRNGLCMTCGYDVRGLAACPECGTASGAR